MLAVRRGNCSKDVAFCVGAALSNVNHHRISLFAQNFEFFCRHDHPSSRFMPVLLPGTDGSFRFLPRHAGAPLMKPWFSLDCLSDPAHHPARHIPDVHSRLLKLCRRNPASRPRPAHGDHRLVPRNFGHAALEFHQRNQTGAGDVSCTELAERPRARASLSPIAPTVSWRATASSLPAPGAEGAGRALESETSDA